MATFFVIIPARNEARNIVPVLYKALGFMHGGQLVVVDDGSTDGTASEAHKHGVTVLRHSINLGKGGALKTGCAYASQHNADAIVFMDSDGQHDPANLPNLLEALQGNDIVFTYRDRKSAHMPAIKKIGNASIDFLMKLLFGINVTDTQCGYKALTRKAYETLNLTSNDYSIESEIVAKTGKYHLKFTQVPIKTIYADRYKGTTVFDGISIVLKMLWWKIAR